MFLDSWLGGSSYTVSRSHDSTISTGRVSMHVWRRRADTHEHTHLLDLLFAQLILLLLGVQEGVQLLLLLGHNLLLELLLIGQHRLHLGGTRLLEQQEPPKAFFLPFLNFL